MAILRFSRHIYAYLAGLSLVNIELPVFISYLILLPATFIGLLHGDNVYFCWYSIIQKSLQLSACNGQFNIRDQVFFFDIFSRISLEENR